MLPTGTSLNWIGHEVEVGCGVRDVAVADATGGRVLVAVPAGTDVRVAVLGTEVRVAVFGTVVGTVVRVAVFTEGGVLVGEAQPPPPPGRPSTVTVYGPQPNVPLGSLTTITITAPAGNVTLLVTVPPAPVLSPGSPR